MKMSFLSSVPASIHGFVGGCVGEFVGPQKTFIPLLCVHFITSSVSPHLNILLCVCFTMCLFELTYIVRSFTICPLVHTLNCVKMKDCLLVPVIIHTICMVLFMPTETLGTTHAATCDRVVLVN